MSGQQLDIFFGQSNNEAVGSLSFQLIVWFELKSFLTDFSFSLFVPNTNSKNNISFGEIDIANIQEKKHHFYVIT